MELSTQQFDILRRITNSGLAKADEYKHRVWEDLMSCEDVEKLYMALRDVANDLRLSLNDIEKCDNEMIEDNFLRTGVPRIEDPTDGGAT